MSVWSDRVPACIEPFCAADDRAPKSTSRPACAIAPMLGNCTKLRSRLEQRHMYGAHDTGVASHHKMFLTWMLATEITNRLHEAEADLHARSIYLRGLFVTAADRRPRWARSFGGALAAFDRWGGDGADGAAVYTSLSLVLARTKASRRVVGVEDVEQIGESDTTIIEQWAEIAAQAPNAVTVDGIDVIDLRHWEPV